MEKETISLDKYLNEDNNGEITFKDLKFIKKD
jgi:hypothetical protein